jgi:hypothetical protein
MFRYRVTDRPSALIRYNGPRMSFTNRAVAPGSGTRIIIRAAAPSMSGMAANSR